MEVGVVLTVCVKEVAKLSSLLYILIYTYIHALVCLMLDNPADGNINCSLGDDKIPTHEDTCSFTCDTGYELTGNDIRTCESDGNWSGTEINCTKG